MTEEIRKLAHRLPESRHSRPPLSLIARVWSLIELPHEGEDFTYAETHLSHPKDPDGSEWSVVVSDHRHIVHVHGTLNDPLWTSYEQEDRSRSEICDQEAKARIVATRLPLKQITKIASAGEPTDWVNSDRLPPSARWTLHWPDGSSVEVPLASHPQASEVARARQFVLGLDIAEVS
jgi:hypothetical protein